MPATIKNNLDNPDFIRAIIMHRSNPIERGSPSPNELLLGRNVPDYLNTSGDAYSEQLHGDETSMWETCLRALEEIREVRQEECAERWGEHTRQKNMATSPNSGTRGQGGPVQQLQLLRPPARLLQRSNNQEPWPPEEAERTGADQDEHSATSSSQRRCATGAPEGIQHDLIGGQQ